MAKILVTNKSLTLLPLFLIHLENVEKHNLPELDNPMCKTIARLHRMKIRLQESTDDEREALFKKEIDTSGLNPAQALNFGKSPLAGEFVEWRRCLMVPQI